MRKRGHRHRSHAENCDGTPGNGVGGSVHPEDAGRAQAGSPQPSCGSSLTAGKKQVGFVMLFSCAPIPLPTGHTHNVMWNTPEFAPTNCERPIGNGGKRARVETEFRNRTVLSGQL